MSYNPSMGTTVWVEDATRDELRMSQHDLGTNSVNATIQYLTRKPALDARALFAVHFETIRSLMKRHRVRKLIAYGSRARGEARPTSDLDLAVKMASNADPLAVLALEADLEEALGVPVSVVELPNERVEKAIGKEGIPFGR